MASGLITAEPDRHGDGMLGSAAAIETVPSINHLASASDQEWRLWLHVEHTGADIAGVPFDGPFLDWPLLRRHPVLKDFCGVRRREPTDFKMSADLPFRNHRSWKAFHDCPPHLAGFLVSPPYHSRQFDTPEQ
jgi:hypothetical protein